MDYQNMINANRYLSKFNEILYNMAREMKVSYTTSNITVDFIKCMIPNCMATISICENFLEYINYIPLKNLADNIISMQKNEVKQMEEIGKTTIPYINKQRDVDNYFKKYFKITDEMINGMYNSIRTPDIILDFIYEMIPNNEGVVKLCKNLLRFEIDPRIRILANNIIVQENECIRILKEIENNVNKKYPYY